MLTRPANVPRPAWARVERALIDADTALTDTPTAGARITAARGGIIYHESEFVTRAITLVIVPVYERVLEVLLEVARADAWTAEELRTEAETLLDAVIVDGERRVSAPPADFRGRAAGVVRARPSWLALQDARKELSTVDARRSAAHPAAAPGAPRPAATAATSSPRQETVSIKEAATILHVHPDTIRRMGARGEIEIVSIGSKLKRIPRSEIARLKQTDKFARR